MWALEEIVGADRTAMPTHREGPMYGGSPGLQFSLLSHHDLARFKFKLHAAKPEQRCSLLRLAKLTRKKRTMMMTSRGAFAFLALPQHAMPMSCRPTRAAKQIQTKGTMMRTIRGASA